MVGGMIERLAAFDCEGPISKNDNAQEITAFFVPDGAEFFAKVSKYDDYLADLVKKPGYKAGDTLRLILPFLKVCGATNKKIAEYSAANILLVPGAADTVRFINGRMPCFIISTSYRPYIHALCETIGFPEEQTYATELDIDQYQLEDWEDDRICRIGNRILGMPMLDWPDDATSAEGLSKTSKDIAEVLDYHFWEEISSMPNCGRMLREVNPVGGVEKARALQDALERTGVPPDEAMYIGDSITDVQAFRWLRERDGVTVSFNGNGYAVREAQVACMAGHTIVLSILAEVFLKWGKSDVIQLASDWSHSVRPLLIEWYGVDKELLTALSSVYPTSLLAAHPPDPALFPQVELVSPDNQQRLIETSEAFRKEVRGEEIGKLG